MPNHTESQERDDLSLTGRIATKPPDSGLSPDEILDILGNQRRRYTVGVLADHFGIVEFRQLVADVAELETNQSWCDVERSTRESIRNSIYQTHLPKLERNGIIERVRKSGTIRAADNAPAVFGYLKQLCETAAPRTTASP